jgi:hypothetical protein
MLRKVHQWFMGGRILFRILSQIPKNPPVARVWRSAITRSLIKAFGMERTSGIDRTLYRALALMTLLSVVAGARASTITYDWTGGAVTLSATNANTGAQYLAAGQTIPLTSPSQVTFNSSAMTVPSFEFADAGPTTVPLQGALSAYSLEVSGLSVIPDASYSSSVTGTGPTYNYSLGALDAAGSYEIIRNSNSSIVQSGTFSKVDPILSGQFTLNSNTDSLTLTGIALGAFSYDGATINLKGDVAFTGAAPVPVPASIWLFGSGLVGLWRSRAMHPRRAA